MPRDSPDRRVTPAEGTAAARRRACGVGGRSSSFVIVLRDGGVHLSVPRARLSGGLLFTGGSANESRALFMYH